MPSGLNLPGLRYPNPHYAAPQPSSGRSGLYADIMSGGLRPSGGFSPLAVRLPVSRSPMRPTLPEGFANPFKPLIAPTRNVPTPEQLFGSPRNPTDAGVSYGAPTLPTGFQNPFAQPIQAPSQVQPWGIASPYSSTKAPVAPPATGPWTDTKSPNGTMVNPFSSPRNPVGPNPLPPGVPAPGLPIAQDPGVMIGMPPVPQPWVDQSNPGNPSFPSPRNPVSPGVGFGTQWNPGMGTSTPTFRTGGTGR